MSTPDANGWLPIETAPKDGTPVDLWAERVELGGYDRVTDCSWELMTDWTGDEFFGWSGLHITLYRSYKSPTHWRPIPQGPVQP